MRELKKLGDQETKHSSKKREVRFTEDRFAILLYNNMRIRPFFFKAEVKEKLSSISAALSCLVCVLPREEPSREERGLLSRTAAGDRA